MNKVTLIGRLTKDPDVRFTSGERQLAIARYTLAVDRRKSKGTDNPGADFISCVTFDRGAEFAERFLKKGTKIAVNGRIQTGSYKNRDGATVYTTDVVVEEHEFVESKGSGNTNTRTAPTGDDGFMNIPDDVEDSGLPFN